ncbi:hypothetical protein SEA_NYCEIRAE_33 [Gordonia phage Nyceirae]|uniref:Uncharacterized protein n=1 Tax=Gordonia phage Nyceirae TaxID=1887651 RepID=A0A1C9EHY5_9CAUD|nr:hypothetical protein BIZ68_gp33 [Gordonia phage Nyceirae]AON97396.1 hypothetical protein SEA_NYCEIRAE_33 [Gordonia phage Nyceirae]
MTTRRLDVASAGLVMVGIVCGVFSCWLAGVEALIITPSAAALTVGVTRLFKREAPRE